MLSKAPRLAARAQLRASIARCPSRRSSTKHRSSNEPMPPFNNAADIEAFLSTPSWSVASLLPAAHDTLAESATEAPPVTPAKLRHLLRLAALPEPATPAREAEMLADLAAQLHFVRQVQRVDVAGVEPLQGIRDETEAGECEAEITLERVRETLEREEVVGQYYPRLRRRRDPLAEDLETPAGWRPLEHASRTVGDYFLVDRSEEKKG